MATHAVKQAMISSRRPAASAADPILAAKVTAPDVPDWALQRPRITKMIAQGTRCCQLTTVTGPAGAGKTMALALWAAAESGPVAWISLDEYDNRPEAFWPYVVAALRRSGVAAPRAPSATARGRTAQHHPFLLRLASVLAAQNQAVTLVVDDFHLLTEAKALAGLEFLLRNAEAGLRLVAASRSDPPLPLHRYRLTGELAEIRAGDLAFSVAEAGELLAQHGCVLPAGLAECLTERTEGWAAGLRLAAMSMAAHPDPGQFVGELVTEDSALTGYLVEEVLDTQPRQARELLLSTCILEQFNAEVARVLTGNQQAGRILTALAHANVFIQPVGGGRYRYHTLFAEILRLKLRLRSPGRVIALHRQAARWYEQNGQLTDAVRHAAQAGEWPLAARIVINRLAIDEIIEPHDRQSLADEFAGMPHDEAWPEPQPFLVAAAIALSAGQPESAAMALNAAETLIEELADDQGITARLAAAMIRLAVSRRTGNFAATLEAAARAEALVSNLPADTLAQHPEIQAHVLSARGVAELWSGRLDQAARALDTGLAAATAAGREDEQAGCLGHLALAEALRGRLGRAAELAGQVTAACGDGGGRPRGQHPSPVALAALAWVHLEHYELGEARSRLKQVDAALRTNPDRLIGAVACLVAARAGLAEGHPEVTAQFVARARSGWPVPAWLERRLDQAEARALAARGDIAAALAAANRADCDGSPEAAVTLAHAWAVAGDVDNARRALAPLLAAHERVPERVQLQACLVDARLSYRSGDRTRGRRALGCALRLAEREQLRLPFAKERGWIGPVLRREPELAGAHQHLFTSAILQAPVPVRPDVPDEVAIAAAEPLTERELQVLRGVSGMLTTAEIASELYISTNTVKSHIKNICHKLATAHRNEAVRRARQLQLI